MSEIIGYKEVEEKVLTIRGENVLLDNSVAELYGVETREINQAVKNNQDKFPEGYIIDLTTGEWENLKSKFLTSSFFSCCSKVMMYPSRNLSGLFFTA